MGTLTLKCSSCLGSIADTQSQKIIRIHKGATHGKVRVGTSNSGFRYPKESTYKNHPATLKSSARTAEKGPWDPVIVMSLSCDYLRTSHEPASATRTLVLSEQQLPFQISIVGCIEARRQETWADLFAQGANVLEAAVVWTASMPATLLLTKT